MGLLRGGLAVIFSIAFFLTLLFSNLFLTLSWSLEYPVVKDSLHDFAEDYIESFGIGEILEKDYSLIKDTCKYQEKYAFYEQDFSFEIPCEIVANGLNETISYGIDSLIENVYYKEYNCSFWNCVKNSDVPLVLVSEKARLYWQDLFKWGIFASMFLFILIFILMTSKGSAFITLGILSIVSALPFKKLNWVSGVLPAQINEFLTIFTSRSNNVFLIVLIIGIILLFIGISLNLFGIGRHLSDLLQKIFSFSKKEDKEITKEEVKDLVKEEIKKQKKDIPKKKSK